MLINLTWHWVCMKKILGIIKDITLRYDYLNSQPITEIKADNNLVTDSNIMENTFNYLFSNVRPVKNIW